MTNSSVDDSKQVNLLDFSRTQLVDYFIELGEARYRAEQMTQWIHQYGVTDFEQMTNLSKKLRAVLQEKTVICAPEIVKEQRSQDGTCKWLMRLYDGNAIETVFIPEEGRGTLCVSSQVGCSLNCSFCSTARQGLSRNLAVSEIIGQVFLAVRKLSSANGHHDRKITNIVMMGMGEPLLNFDNVVASMDLMLDDFAYGLAKKRVTLSTAGVVPEMQRLAECSPVALAVSLHAPNNALRDLLVPLNKKYPLEQLMSVCRDYYRDEPRRQITFEYVMLDGINDQLSHAKQLVQLISGIPAKVNLIPFNPFPQAEFKRSPDHVIVRFRDQLTRAGIVTVTRKTRGDDIDAACGQLAGKVTSVVRRQHHIAKKLIDLPIQLQKIQTHDAAKGS